MFGRKRLSLIATVFAVAACACPAASAQEGVGAVETRIDDVFELVPQNTLELAVPLSRRALSERADGEGGESGALFFTQQDESAAATAEPAPPEPPPAAIAAVPPEPSAAISPEPALPVVEAEPPPPAVAEVEEGSAEDFDADIARLPRARPDAGDAGAPLDLVAGAALPVPPEAPVSDVPQELLPPPAPVLVTASAVADGAEVADAPPAAAAPLPPTADLTAAGACAETAEITDEDGDLSRNAAALAGLCVEQEEFRERRREWVIQTVSSGRTGPLFVLMHDDEDIAFDNAVLALRAHGGVLVALETGGHRNMDGVDPNRNFSAEGIGCSKLGGSAAPEFAAVFKDLIDASQPIIALHNNPDGPIPTGGVGHVTMESPARDMQLVRSADPDGALADDHSLALIASPDPISDAVEARAQSLAEKGVNVIIEPVREGHGDCSLSNYAVLNGHENYFNVTVDHDNGDKQRQIVDLIISSFFTVAASN